MKKLTQYNTNVLKQKAKIISSFLKKIEIKQDNIMSYYDGPYLDYDTKSIKFSWDAEIFKKGIKKNKARYSDVKAHFYSVIEIYRRK